MVQKPHIEMDSNSNINEASRIPRQNSLSKKNNECYFMENGRPNDETIDRFFNNSDAVPAIAILGATDYLGAHLTNLFLDKGYKVKAFILPESSAKYEILNTISTVANEQPYTYAKMVCENFVEQLIQVRTGFASENSENASDGFYLNELKLKNLLRILPWFNTTKCQEWENALYGCNYVICNLAHLTQTTPHKQAPMDKNATFATREENNATQNQNISTKINGNEINQAENVTTNVVELKSEPSPNNQKLDQETQEETQETQELSLDDRLELSLKALLKACQTINCQEMQQGDNYVAKIKRVIVTSSFMTILGNGNSIVEGKEYTEQDWNTLINTTSKDNNNLMMSPLIKAMTRCETKLYETLHKSDAINDPCNGEKRPDDWIKPTDFDIVILNPVFMMGPSIYQNFDYIGFELIRKLLKKDVLSGSASKLALNIIDVRDVAISHYAALMCPLVSNMRIILNNRSATMKEIAQIAHKELKYTSLHRSTPVFLNGPPKAENNTNKAPLEKNLTEKVDKNGDVPKCEETNEKDDKPKTIEKNVQSIAENTEQQNLPESCQTLTDEKMGEEGNKQEEAEICEDNTEEGKTDIKDNTSTITTATNNANNNNFIASLLKSWFFSPPPQNTQNIMDEIDGGNREGNAKEFGIQNPASNSSIFYNVEQWFNSNNVGTGQLNISVAKNASLNILQNPSNLKLGDIVKEIQKNTFPIYSINPNATVPDLICSNYRMREILRIIPRELHQTISEMTKELIIFCFNNSFQLPTVVNTLENQTTPGKNMGQSTTLINAPLKSTLTTSAVLNSFLNVFGRKDSSKEHQQSDIEMEKSVQMILPNLDPNILIPPTDLQHYTTDITGQEEGVISESSRNPHSEEPIISSKDPTKSENVKKPQTEKIATGKSFQHKLQHSLSMNRIKMFTVRNSKNNAPTKENSENKVNLNTGTGNEILECQKQEIDNFDGKNELEPLEKKNKEEGTEIEIENGGIQTTVSKPPSLTLTKLGKKKWSLHYPSNPLINFSLIRHPLHTGTQEQNQENQKLLKLKLKHSSNKQENTKNSDKNLIIDNKTEENSMAKNKDNLEARISNEMLVKSLNENIEQNSETSIPTVKEKSSTIGSGFTNMAKCFPHYFKSLVSDHHSSKSHSISGPPSSVSSKSNTIKKIDDSKTENTCKITEELPNEGENSNKPSLSHIEEGTLLLSPSFVTYVKVESDHISTVVSTGSEQPLESCSKINTNLFSPTNKLLRSNLISGFNTTNSNSKNSNNKSTTPPVVLIARRTLSPDGDNINTESIMISKNQNLSDITLLDSPKKTCLVQVKTPEFNNGADNSVFCNGGDSTNHSDEETNVKTENKSEIEIENNLAGSKISGHRRNPSFGLINTISSNGFEKTSIFEKTTNHDDSPLTNGRHYFEGEVDLLEKTLENGYNHSSSHLNGFHHSTETQQEENAEGEILDKNDGIVKEPTTIVEITAKKSNVVAYNFEVGTNPRSPTSSTNMTIINA